MNRDSNGWIPMLERCTGLVDGAESYRYSGVVSEFPDELDLGAPIEWIAGPDDESDDLDMDMGITPGLLAALVLRARTHCPSCEGCSRG